MLKFLTIIGARPQIIKSAAISRAIRDNYKNVIQEIIVHTGQHYDEKMSAVFFQELQIPLPDFNLQAGSGKHGQQTAKMITGIEEILEKENPNLIIIYGDTNSTLAAAIAASKMLIPIVHIEAGLRSFNKKMPEEINRILSDHISTYLFPPTETGYLNLIREGFASDTIPPYSVDNPAVKNFGDIMYDNTMFFSLMAENSTSILKRLDLKKNNFILATLHRNANTDNSNNLNAILRAIQKISTLNNTNFVIPLHPRTVKQINLLLDKGLKNEIDKNERISSIEPLSYLEMLQLEQNASIIMTDSGGVQKEAYFLQKPSIILRPETEWVEIIENKAGILTDANEQRIIEAYYFYKENPEIIFKNCYGNANAAGEILQFLLSNI